MLDVRSPEEYAGVAGAPCDPRQGHIPGARNLDVQELLAWLRRACASSWACLQGPRVVAYCHSGSRSALAVQLLRAAGYDARNYVGSWHEWSRDESLAAVLEPAGSTSAAWGQIPA